MSINLIEIKNGKRRVPEAREFTLLSHKISLTSYYVDENSLLAEKLIYSMENTKADILISIEDKVLKRQISSTPSYCRLHSGKILDSIEEKLPSAIRILKKHIQGISGTRISMNNSLMQYILLLEKEKIDSSGTLESFIYRYLEENCLVDMTPHLDAERCGFIVHPLYIDHVAEFFKLKKDLKNYPPHIKDTIEFGLSRLPGFKAGVIGNITSEFNGKTIHCDIYSLFATPKEFVRMPPKTAYKQLVKLVEKSKDNGANICGLGAFTKVVGDSGVSVHNLSSIPVTTGNALSAAATLWSARYVVDRMNIIPRNKKGIWKGTAMVVGATGSIGSSLSKLLAQCVDKIILMAPNPLKLQELESSIREIDKRVEIVLTTDSNSHISEADVIVTATSVYEGSIFNMDLVKSGCVIVECSRPLNISKKDAESRDDVLVVNSGEVTLPGDLDFRMNLGLSKGVVFACLAETVVLCLEGLIEPFSLSREIPWQNIKKIYRLSRKHGVKLAPLESILGDVSDEMIDRVTTNVREES